MVAGNGVEKTLSHRQIQRKIKRELKAKELAEKKALERAAAAAKRAALNPKQEKSPVPKRKGLLVNFQRVLYCDSNFYN